MGAEPEGLSKVHEQWTGHTARLLRTVAMRLSVRDFAARLGVPSRTVSKWESAGESRTPRGHMQSILDTALTQADDEARVRFERALQADSANEANCQEVEAAPDGVTTRSEALSIPGVPLFDSNATSLDLDAGQAEDVIDVLRRLHRMNRSVDPEIIRHLKSNLRDTVTHYGWLDHSELIPKLLKQRAWVDALLDECSHPRERQQLFEVAGGTSGLLGYVAVGRSNFPLSRAYCAEAFKFGEFAQEANLQAWVRGLQSFCEYYAEEYDEALRLAVDGLNYSKSGPQSVRLTINGIARAMGKLGDVDGVHRAVDDAYDFLSRNAAPSGLPSSITFECYSAAQTASNAATAYVSLGIPEKVQQYVDLALPDIGNSGSSWSRSLVMIDSAVSMIPSKEADMERASALVLDALSISADRPIVSVQKRAMEFVRDGTQRWGRVRQLGEIRQAIPMRGVR